MVFRALVFGVVLLGGALGWLVAEGGPFVLSLEKDNLVDAYARAGVDVKACQEASRTILDPSGGIPECLESSFKDIARKIESPSSGFSVETGPQEAPPAEEPELE